jgi:hypothetical protein
VIAGAEQVGQRVGGVDAVAEALGLGAREGALEVEQLEERELAAAVGA